ncbi:hypothetical protein CFD26_100337 [Aspergillus turcosus]|uniref:Uncharacterized protein n=1 Tax=Aspergillus turcosus TaxID=1245748 RepID=A0A3R7JBT0_9EURO|nr:hypothetical protein CFD26_100337 [Aspergillus turcosus]
MNIPNEIILAIASFLDCEKDISSLSQTNRILYTVVNAYLYRHNVQTSNSSALLWAAENGHQGVAEKVIRTGGAVAIRTRSSAGETSLLLAAKQRQLSMARWLLGYCGIDPNCQDVYGRTPLFWACRQGNEDIVDLLLEQPWIQPDLPDTAYALSQSEKHYGRTPLAHAVINGHGKIVERLIGLGVDLNSRDLLGKTPLYHAVEAGNIHLVSLLLATSGINPNARNYKRAMAPLHYAAWKGNVAIVGLLLAVEDIDVNVKNQAQRLPVHGRPVEVQSYLQEKARLGELEYTIIAVGLFLDYVVPSPIVVDLVNRTAVLYNGGEHPFSTTSVASIGKAIGFGIGEKVHSACRGLEKTNVDAEAELAKFGRQTSEKGMELPLVLGLLKAAVFGGKYPSAYKNVDNELLGLGLMGEDELEARFAARL